MTDPQDKPFRQLLFVGSSRKDLSNFPDNVKGEIGYALYVAQKGGRAPSVKTLSGFGGGGVVEVVEDDDGDTYRCVYTVKFKSGIYVLHAFKKKSKRGAQTPKHDIELVRSRLRDAEELDKAHNC